MRNWTSEMTNEEIKNLHKILVKLNLPLESANEFLDGISRSIDSGMIQRREVGEIA